MATRDTARSLPKVLYAHERTLRMNFTAPMPLLATRMLRSGGRTGQNASSRIHTILQLADSVGGHASSMRSKGSSAPGA